jgi:hypothetical protein
MNLFELAELQLIREGKEPQDDLVIKYAIIIRKWWDKHGKHAQRIMQGGQIYNYGNVIKTYVKVC